MTRLLLLLLTVVALPATARAEWSCAESVYASELCPWFGTSADGFAAPTVGMRWSGDGYLPGSAVGRWNDGIYVIIQFPRTEPPGEATLVVDIGYEPHRHPDEARDLEPVGVILRLGDRQWRNDTARLLSSAPDQHRWLRDVYFEGSLYRFTFPADLVAAMLASSEAGPSSYNALYSDDSPGVLQFEILFREPEGGIVSSNEILEITREKCQTRCRPVLSLAGFADMFRQATDDIDDGK